MRFARIPAHGIVRAHEIPADMVTCHSGRAVGACIDGRVKDLNIAAPDGCHSLLSAGDRLYVGGNCTIRGYDKRGRETYFNFAGDVVCSMCIVSGLLVAATRDGFVRWYSSDDSIFAAVREWATVLETAAIDDAFWFAGERGFGMYAGRERRWVVSKRGIAVAGAGECALVAGDGWVGMYTSAGKCMWSVSILMDGFLGVYWDDCAYVVYQDRVEEFRKTTEKVSVRFCRANPIALDLGASDYEFVRVTYGDDTEEIHWPNGKRTVALEKFRFSQTIRIDVGLHTGK